jgi:hypothetical protein
MSKGNQKRHAWKVQNAARWLARWGVVDGATLVRISGAKNKGWPRRLVQIGLAQPVDVARRGVLKLRTVYVATGLCREIARAAGYDLVAPYTVGSDLKHRILTVRVCAHIIDLARDLGLETQDYLTDPEMRRHGKLMPEDRLDRLPDGKLKFRSMLHSQDGENDGGVIYIEIERQIRSGNRLDIMRSGIAKLLNEKTSVHAADSVLIVCESRRVFNSYQRAMAPDTVYEEYKRSGITFKPTGEKLKMPAGVHVVMMDVEGNLGIDAAALARFIQISNLQAALGRGEMFADFASEDCPSPPVRRRAEVKPEPEAQPAP